eukprot:gene3443-6092_t
MIKNCETVIDESILSKMRIYKSQKSISKYNKEGQLVLLFFMRYLGCIHTQGLINDIFETEKELLKLNIPVLCFQENETIILEYFKEKKKSLNFICDEKLRFRNSFNKLNKNEIKKNSNINESIIEILRLKNEGITQIKKYTLNRKNILNNLNVECYLIQNLKIVQEIKYEYLYDRLDIFSFVIDPNLFGDIEKYSICNLGLFYSKNELEFKKNNKMRISKQRINKKEEEEKIKELIKDKENLKNIFSKEEQQNIPILNNMLQRKTFMIYSKNNEIKQKEKDDEIYSIENYTLTNEIKEKKNKYNLFKSSTEIEDIDDIYNSKCIEYSMNDILNDNNLYPYFKVFLSIENLSEYFIFYEEYLFFKNELNNIKYINNDLFEKQKEFISNFFLIFFDPESILFLNLTDENRKDFNLKFNEQMIKQEFNYTLFDSILKINLKIQFTMK